VDLDVSKFFDSVRWDLALNAVSRHTDQKWILLYVERWLKAPMRMPDGALTVRTQGTPQGGPISPLLANLFLHYGMDVWLSREYPGCRFERFADDAVIHCVTERQALAVKERLGARFADIGLLLHPDKTKIVLQGRETPTGLPGHVLHVLRVRVPSPGSLRQDAEGKVYELPACAVPGEDHGDGAEGQLVENPPAHEPDTGRHRPAGKSGLTGLADLFYRVLSEHGDPAMQAHRSYPDALGKEQVQATET
jgi:hypothetical protein